MTSSVLNQSDASGKFRSCDPDKRGQLCGRRGFRIRNIALDGRAGPLVVEEAMPQGAERRAERRHSVTLVMNL